MDYIPKGVCSKKIHFNIINNKVTDVKFTGGCSGNAQGISRLIEGMDIEDAISKLKGIKCGSKSTSCPDQLSQALEKYIKNNLYK